MTGLFHDHLFMITNTPPRVLIHTVCMVLGHLTSTGRDTKKADGKVRHRKNNMLMQGITKSDLPLQSFESVGESCCIKCQLRFYSLKSQNIENKEMPVFSPILYVLRQNV